MSSIIWRKAKHWKYAHAFIVPPKIVGGGFYGFCGRWFRVYTYPPVMANSDDPCMKCLERVERDLAH